MLTCFSCNEDIVFGSRILEKADGNEQKYVLEMRTVIFKHTINASWHIVLKVGTFLSRVFYVYAKNTSMRFNYDCSEIIYVKSSFKINWCLIKSH